MNKRLSLFLAFLLAMTACAASEDKGYCPPAPPKPRGVLTESVPSQSPPVPDAKFAGTVSLLTVISDKGYVCSVQLIRGFDKAANTQAMRAIRQWHFSPARKDGRPVPVVVNTEVSFWRDATGQLVQGTPNQSAK
jgi:TonB family protein